MRHWTEDKAWADRYLPEIQRVVKLMAHKIVTVAVSPPEDDQFRATDYVVTVKAGDIACRVRKWEYWARFHDFTLRASRPSGIETEVSKIQRGYGDWYLYAWVGPDDKFAAWIFVDLDSLRYSSMLLGAREIPNRDASSTFIGISIADLWSSECLIGHGGAASDIVNKCEHQWSQVTLPF